MNINENKIMTNITDNIVDNNLLEKVDQYIYLGHIIKVGKDNQSAEIQRKIRV